MVVLLSFSRPQEGLGKVSLYPLCSTSFKAKLPIAELSSKQSPTRHKSSSVKDVMPSSLMTPCYWAMPTSRQQGISKLNLTFIKTSLAAKSTITHISLNLEIFNGSRILEL
jgi:hypothetical protein